MNRHAVELYEGLMTTRSMHRFTDEPVGDHDIWEILRAAQQAPTGGHDLPVHFVVVTDAEQRARLGDLHRRAHERYEAAVLAQAPERHGEDLASFERSVAAARHLAEHLGEVPVLIAVATDASSLAVVDRDGVMDVGTPGAAVFLAVGNLLLAARSRGLGTALTTEFRIHHDEVRDVLGVPPTHELVALVALGHAEGRFARARRRPIETITHWNRWDDQRLAT